MNIHSYINISLLAKKLNKRNEPIFKCHHKKRFKLILKFNYRKIDCDNSRITLMVSVTIDIIG